jgi:hypothetical protein
MVVLLLLVSGGGVAAVADLAGEAVDGAGAVVLDAAASFAPGADLHPPAALDVAGAAAFAAAAERGDVQPPHPDGEGSDDGQDEGAFTAAHPLEAAARPPLLGRLLRETLRPLIGVPDSAWDTGLAACKVNRY